MKRLQAIMLMLSLSSIANAQETSQAVSEFSFDLYKQIAEGKSQNVVFSPFSISPTLGMIALGANGETEQQIAKVFHFNLNNPNFHRQMGRLQNNIGKLNSASSQISIANRIFIEKTYGVRCKYKRNLKKAYNVKTQQISFINEPEQSRLTINGIIEQDTKNHINDLLPNGSIDNTTRLVLTNAIYFKGKWEVGFSPEQTMNREFTLSTGERIECPTMYVKNRFKTFEGKNHKALQMDYTDGNISMLIILPNEKVNIADFEKELSYDLYKTIVSSLASNDEIKLYLPKFKITSNFALKEEFTTMGMPIAFSNDADFSPIAKRNDLKIDNVYHKAFIEVSEEGTTAAAATAATMIRKTSFSPESLFFVNRPFIYIVHDNATQTILFIGKIEKPE